MADQNTSTSSKKSYLAIAGVLILGLLVLLLGRNKSQEMNTATNTATNTPTEESKPVATPETVPAGSEAATVTYKDGSYSAVGTYTVPGGSENLGVELVLKDGVIIAVKIDQLATNPTSQKLQAMFVSGVEAAVVGKKIDELSLTKVSGSSLTPKGFNDALEKIKEEAKA